MSQAHRFYFLTSSRIVQSAFAALLLLLIGGCAVTPPRVDPYATLLPAGAKLADGVATFAASDLKQETAYLVVGANFNTYAEVWTKFQKSVEGGSGNLVYSKAFLLDGMAQWSPAKITSLVVTSLQKKFRNVIVVNDLAEAKDKRAKWIVMFDHAFVQTSTLTATWTNSTSIDLLDNNFRRVAATAISEHKDYGGANDEADVKRFMGYRGDDILRTVKAAVSQFEGKLSGTS